tara:strand:+ start:955 stop:1416 length:462 start_codon:yes stop_codon:yes gene_type:complete
MNTLMLVVLAVVALCYCGGKYCPKVLKDNKEVVLGVLVGMALCSFAGLKLEGVYVGIGKENCDQSRMNKGRTEPCTDSCECHGSMTCNNGLCGAKTSGTNSADDEAVCDTEKLNMCRTLIDDGFPPNQVAPLCVACRGQYESGGVAAMEEGGR